MALQMYIPGVEGTYAVSLHRPCPRGLDTESPRGLDTESREFVLHDHKMEWSLGMERDGLA